MKSALKVFLIGCGGLMAVGIAIVVGLVVWLASGPASGVKLTNELDPYAIEYLAEHALLDPEEKVLAYYDVTLSMDGSEAAILTNARVIYHKAGNTTAISLAEVTDVEHRYESFIGDVIEIEASDGAMIKIEIAPFNGGETFKNALDTAIDRAQLARQEAPSQPDSVAAAVR